MMGKDFLLKRYTWYKCLVKSLSVSDNQTDRSLQTCNGMYSLKLHFPQNYRVKLGLMVTASAGTPWSWSRDPTAN